MQGGHALERFRNEFLPAETGEHRHYQEIIRQADIGIELLDRDVWIHGQTGFHAERANASEEVRSVVPRSLKMEGAVCRPLGGYLLKPSLRMHHHEMYIHRGRRNLRHMVDHGEAEGNVGHEGAVHHVEVNHVAALVHEPDVLFQMKKVRGKNGRGYLEIHIV